MKSRCGFTWQPDGYVFARVCNLPVSHEGPHYGGDDPAVDWYPAPPSDDVPCPVCKRVGR